MKTLEFKVNINESQQQQFNCWVEELGWVWNEGLKLLLEFHQVKYYDYMIEVALERGIDMNGIDMVRLSFPKKSAWSMPTSPTADRVEDWLKWHPKQEFKFVGLGGATCTIATIVDGIYTPIAKDDRYTVETPRLKRDSDTCLGAYLTQARLNQMRAEQELPPLTIHSDYIGGLFCQLATAWKNYCDPKIRHAHKPKFRGKDNPINSLFSNQPRNQLGVRDGQIIVPGLGLLPIVGQRLSKRLPEGSLVRSATIRPQPSGVYVCLVVASPLELERQRVKRDRSTARREAKKADGKLLPELELAFKQELDRVETALMVESRAKAKIKPSTKIVGIDPGVVNLITTDNGRSYAPNGELKRQERKLKRLQRKASRQFDQNKDKEDWQRRNHDKTQRQIALTWEKIRRSRSAYTHKLSTKLVREFGTIVIEDTQLGNMTKAAKPKVNEAGTGYERNNRAAKAGLNRSILNSGIGQLRARIEEKAKSFDRNFIKSPAQRSSMICHCCGEVGNRETQADFYCLNGACQLYAVRQNADVNASRNHLIRGIEIHTKTEYRSLVRELKPGESVSSPTGGTTCSNAGETLSHVGTPQEIGKATAGEPCSEYEQQSHPTVGTFKDHFGKAKRGNSADQSDQPNPPPRKRFKRQRHKQPRDPDMEQLSLDLDTVDGWNAG